MTAAAFLIRPFHPADWPQLWRILHAEFASGESHPQPPDMPESAARRAWVETPESTFVAVQGDTLVGTYLIKPNQPGLGAHVCNCGYIVAHEARQRGVGRAMCQHSLDEARQRGYRAMQYNLVVATNTPALTLWRSMGFETIGRLPEAFHHPRHGYVDAFVMMRAL